MPFYAVETAPWNAVEIRSRACQPGRCDREKKDRFRLNDNHRYILIHLFAVLRLEIYRTSPPSAAPVLEFFEDSQHPAF